MRVFIFPKNYHDLLVNQHISQRVRVRAAQNRAAKANRLGASHRRELCGGNAAYRRVARTQLHQLATNSVAARMAVWLAGRVAAQRVCDNGQGGAAGRDCEIGCGATAVAVFACAGGVCAVWRNAHGASGGGLAAGVCCAGVFVD